MNAIARRRGQPVYVLLIVIAAWLVFRIIFWQLPFAGSQSIPDFLSVDRDAHILAGSEEQSGRATSPELVLRSAPGQVVAAPQSVLGARINRQIPDPVPASQPLAPYPNPQTVLPARDIQPAVAAGHQILFAAGLAHLPLIDAVRQALSPEQAPLVPVHSRVRAKRWTLDAWLLARQGGSGSGPQAFRPASYGASQTGAVVRYRLGYPHAGSNYAYARASQALVAGGETDLALGIGWRPFPSVPVAVHTELRATEAGGDIDVRPSAFAVTQLPALALPAGIAAEAYAQAGYVGGDFATAFADGQLRIDREIAGFDLASIRAGAGTWGGAQRGAARVDIGPTASVRLKLGKVPARIAVDYRVRVAGQAAPGSGLAVTLTTGF